jgi:Polysaccharide pyruvyl transferase
MSQVLQEPISRIDDSTIAVADIARWSDTAQLSVDWDQRAKAVAGWIPAGVRLMDIGCGRMALEPLLTNCTYWPVDIVRRDERTTVVDLNESELPSRLLQQADYATLLGVLEYMKDPAKLLTSLSAARIKLVCSYQLADNSSGETRTNNGWFNAFTAMQFSQLIRDCGYEVEQAKRMGEQGLYLLSPILPESAAPASNFSLHRLFSKLGRADSNIARIVAKAPAKPRLVLSGFFGRGNVGDEAILQVQYEKLKDDFDIIISVEQRGAYDGYWNWYPYNHCHLIHQAESAIFNEPDVVGIHVGGGDLPIGFNASQVIAALGCGKKVTSTGVDFGWAYELAARNARPMAETYLSWTQPWVRSLAGYQLAQQISSNVHFGADWGLHLTQDEAPDTTRGETLLVLREFPIHMLTPQLRDSLHRMVCELQHQTGSVRLLPFCPEDERFLDSLECTWGLPREVHWWNPRRIKQLIAQAKRVVSVGRFHPLIFCASTATPCVFTEWGTDLADGQSTNIDRKATTKAQRLCTELKIPYFANLDDFAKTIRTLVHQPVTASKFDEDYYKRFDDMLDYVRQSYRVRQFA